ncbi:unnamed protein product [Spirodela intermedia]|uniref:Uncharacterized protein n=1 Tax=Spirodela intermedia TaxID=51605 RepID=A0A7I8LBG4_SPIIN|nr:unnamed protein product [Spirodela intermedia]
MVDSICGGAFMEKTPDEIYSLYENLSENSRDQASFELYDRDKKRGIYELHHDDDSKLRNEVNQINQRLEKIDLLIDNIRKPFNPQLNSNSTCPMYGENDYSEFQCYNLDQSFHPMQEQVQVAHGFNRNRENFSNSYNPNWRNNLSWRDPNNIQNPEALRPNSNSEFRPKQENRFQKNQPSQTQPDAMEMMQQMSQMMQQTMNQMMQHQKQIIEALENKREEGQLPSQPIENSENCPTVRFQQEESSWINLEKNPRNENQDELRKIVPFPKIVEPKLRKRVEPNEELMEIFKQVHISIPLVDVIKHIPTYVKFLKELYTLLKLDFLSETTFRNVLLDLKVNVNLLSLTILKNFELEELKLTLVELQLITRSIKTPRSLLEDVIIHVKEFRFLVDVFILNISILDNLTHAPIILGRLFLATTKANIDCKNRIRNMKFESQNISLNAFKSSRFPHKDNDNYEDINAIDSCIKEMNYV